MAHIILDLNTPGGAAVGCFYFAERIYQARGIKPITALVNYHAYSAGYMIAAAASDIIVSTTSGVGSIGVRAAGHVDISQAMEGEGVKVTTFYRGDHKNDMSPYEPVSESAQQVMDQELDELYALFTEKVALYRGMNVADVVATQAATFRGQAAIDIGLADALSYPQDAVDNIAQSLANQNTDAHPPRRSRIGAQAESMKQRAQM